MMFKLKCLFSTAVMSMGILLVNANPYTAPTVLNPNENLVSPYYFSPAVSYAPPEKYWREMPGQNLAIKNGELQLSGKANSGTLTFDWSFVLAEKLKITFNYALKGSGSVYFCGRVFPLSAGTDKIFELEIPVKPVDEGYNGGIRFFCESGGGQLTVKNLTVVPIKPQAVSGKALIFDGGRAEAIYYAETDLKHTFLDHRAACLMQKNLYLAGAGILPVEIIKKDQKIANGIVIGQAAKDYIDAKYLNETGDGGYALKVGKGIAAVYGKDSYSNPAGVFALLKKLGLFYLTNTEYVVPAREQLELNGLAESSAPAVPFRLDGWWGNDSVTTGMSDGVCMSDLSSMFGVRDRAHTIPGFISWEEFKDTNRDFFAMQADGIRRPSERGDVHYCFSNKSLQQLLTKRIKELLDSDPIGELLAVFPGDGMGLACHCEECKKLGTSTDRLVYFVNIVARQIKQTHPDIKLYILAYTDTMEPPVKQKLESNVLVLYCPYEPVWMNHLQSYHKDNSEGWKQLNDWLKACPRNMGAFTYPSCCGELLNLWPSFYVNYEEFKFFAKHNFKVVEYCGLRPWGPNISGHGIFNPAQRYVLAKVLWNPDLNFEKEIDDFFALYYGKAAPALRKLFDLLHAEVKKRDWSQNAEKIIRGFVTPQLADEGMALFGEAEKAVGNEQPYKNRVEREKIYLLWSYLTDINRSNGKLKPADFPEYAKRLSEFCKLGKKFAISYLGRVSFQEWFWDTAMVKISAGGQWYNEPVIAKLISEPEKTLGENIPRIQAKTVYGYMIPAQGMFGGLSLKSGWLRAKPAPVKQLYRPSSGFGIAQMLLTLEQKPAQPIVIKINGIDNEKKGVALMRLLVNGKSAYEGKVPWGKEAWSYESFTVPAELWNKGDNIIQFLNITPDPDENVLTQGRPVSRNYYWGWYLIEDCQFHLK